MPTTTAPLDPACPRALVVALALALGACAPEFGGDEPADLATSTSTSDGDTSGPGGPVSTVTGVTSSAGEGESESEGGERPAGAAPPVIDAFTIDGAASPASVDHAHVAALEVVARDDHAVVAVEIRDGDALIATLTEAPFRFAWPIDDLTAAAPMTLRAIARDAGGQESAPFALELRVDLPPAATTRWRDGGSLVHAGAVRGITHADDGHLIVVGERGLDPESDETHALLRVYDRETGDVMISAAHPKPGTPATFRANAVAVTATGEIAVAGVGTPIGGETRPWLALFKPSGALIRERLGPIAGGESFAVVSGDDGLFVAGQGADGHLFLARHDLDLAPVWTFTDDDPDHSTSELRALVRDGDGDLYVAGAVTEAAIPPRLYAGRFTADGEPRWAGRADCEGVESDRGQALALGPDGDVVIAAAMATEAGLRVELRWVDGATGAPLSASLLPSSIVEGDEVPGSIAVDRRGRVYLTATLRTALGDDAIAYKRSSDGGASIWERIIDSDEHGDDRGLALAVGVDGVVAVGGSRSDEGWPRWWVEALEP